MVPLWLRGGPCRCVMQAVLFLAFEHMVAQSWFRFWIVFVYGVVQVGVSCVSVVWWGACAVQVWFS